MNIGIVGSDSRAVAIAQMLSRAGHQISISDPLSNDRASRAAQSLDGIEPETAYNQAARADMLVFATRWQDVDRTLAAMGPLNDTIVIDTTRPASEATKWSGAELLSRKLDNRHVVKAFTVPPEPGVAMPLASDDPEAKSLVATVIESAGMQAIDAGPLSAARDIERAAERVDPAA